ncbi:hypothetical protein AMR72_00235 [Flavobacterium psychrophilum]|nr:hypothetical protein AMR72_00235 [Flavobacterium psychrophilum]AOE51079.1 hypothetical protein ALW18_00235 [Flavobacterium psychrophilum]
MYSCKAMLYAVLLVVFSASAQETTPFVTPAPEKKIEAGFDGMIAMSYGSDTFGINVGGPSLKYKFTKGFKVGVGAFPSIMIADEKAVPRLAISPIIEYKNWMFITPYYGYDTKDKQIWTFGLGYKFI